MKNLKLFLLRERKGGRPIRDAKGDILTFPDKQQAKMVRDTIGNGTVVSYGPDHKLYWAH